MTAFAQKQECGERWAGAASARPLTNPFPDDRMISRLASPVSFAAALCALCSAATADEKAPPLRLGGPEVARLVWDTRALAPADFDGDGKLDVALLNNENAKLTLLYQRNPGRQESQKRAVSRNRWEPQMEDSRFEKVSLPADQRHFALVAADFDGDGRADLAMTGSEDALTVRFQGEDASFSKTWKWKNFEPLQTTSAMAAADFDGDGKADLAVLGKGKLLIFRQKPEGKFGEPAVYVTTEDKAGLMLTADWDGDGKTDVLYMSGAGEGSLRLRRQVAPGAFSAEIALPYPVPAGGLHASRGADGKLILTGVNARSKIVERHALTADGDLAKEDSLVPVVQSPPGGLKAALRAFGDFNGDGLNDIAEADAKASQVALYLQQADGTFAEPQTYPSLAGLTGLAAVRPAAGQPHVLAVMSAKEGVGISRLTAEGRLEFPVIQQLSGSPFAVAGISQDGKEQTAVAVLAEKDKAWGLQLLARSGDTWSATAVPLKSLKKEPAAMATGDLNGDGRQDILLLNGRDPALVLLAKGDGTGYDEPLAETPTLKSQLSDLAPERLAFIDLDGDRREELVTCGTGYARALRLNADGKDLVIADQYNARAPEDKLATPVMADIDADGAAELIFSEAGGSFWQVFRKDAAGVFRSVRRLSAGSIEAREALTLKTGKEARPVLFVAGKDRFWTVPLSGGRPRLNLVASYETDLANCSHYNAVPADLNGDGKEDLALFDAESKLLEIVTPAPQTGAPWQSLLHFVLFEKNIHFRGQSGQDDVREVLARDFTGDGRTDLLVLVHDRVLLYPQELRIARSCRACPLLPRRPAGDVVPLRHSLRAAGMDGHFRHGGIKALYLCQSIVGAQALLAEPRADDGAGASDAAPAMNIHAAARCGFPADFCQDAVHDRGGIRDAHVRNRVSAAAQVERFCSADLFQHRFVWLQAIPFGREVDEGAHAAIHEGFQVAAGGFRVPVEWIFAGEKEGFDLIVLGRLAMLHGHVCSFAWPRGAARAGGKQGRACAC